MATRSEISRDNKRKADKLEADLVAQNDYLRALGLADVEKVPDPVKITSRRDGEVRGRTLSRSTVDFQGCLKGGLAVYFDAKVTNNETRFEFSALDSKNAKGAKNNRTQREILADAASMGAAAFVYVRHECDFVRCREYLFPVDANGIVAGIETKASISFVNGEAAPFMIGSNQTWFDKLKQLMLARRRREAPQAVEVDPDKGEAAPAAVRRSGEAPDPDQANVEAPIRRLCSTQ